MLHTYVGVSAKPSLNSKSSITNIGKKCDGDLMGKSIKGCAVYMDE